MAGPPNPPNKWAPSVTCRIQLSKATARYLWRCTKGNSWGLKYPRQHVREIPMLLCTAFMPWSHQCFRLVPAMKFVGIMLRSRVEAPIANHLRHFVPHLEKYKAVPKKESVLEDKNQEDYKSFGEFYPSNWIIRNFWSQKLAQTVLVLSEDCHCRSFLLTLTLRTKTRVLALLVMAWSKFRYPVGCWWGFGLE